MALHKVGSARFVWVLTDMRLREVFRGLAIWLMLVGTSFLVGFSFIQGASLFGEASRSAAGAPGLLAGINPLDGIFVSTFGSFYLIQTLLLPFIVVGIFAREKESGAKKLHLQAPWTLADDLFSRFLTFFVVWALVFGVPVSTLAFWNMNGGHIYFPEVLNLMLGHFLYGVIIFGISSFATNLTSSAATAAIIVLAFTLGSWILDFIAPSQTGWLQELSTLSLTAQIRVFESGLLDLGLLLRMLVFATALTFFGIIADKPGLVLKRKLWMSALVVVFAGVTFALTPRQKYSYDLTEDRRHSFDLSSESALRSLGSILEIHIGLSPDDSRFKDYSRSILKPLQRVVPRLHYDFSQTSVAQNALAPKADGTDSYGIVTYTYNGRSDQSRSTSPEEVLPIIFNLAEMKVSEAPEIPYKGYPLELPLQAPQVIYYVVLPFMILGIWFFIRRKQIYEVIGYET